MLPKVKEDVLTCVTKKIIIKCSHLRSWNNKPFALTLTKINHEATKESTNINKSPTHKTPTPTQSKDTSMCECYILYL